MDTLDESKTLFQNLLSVASIDLSKIEKIEMDNLKSNYHKTKKNISSILK